MGTTGSKLNDDGFRHILTKAIIFKSWGDKIKTGFITPSTITYHKAIIICHTPIMLRSCFVMSRHESS
jgi:hypothetical protein